MMGGELSLKNIIYEAMSSFHIGGGDVTWNGGLDDGLNGAVIWPWRMNFFDINASAEGSLVIKVCCSVTPPYYYSAPSSSLTLLLEGPKLQPRHRLCRRATRELYLAGRG